MIYNILSTYMKQTDRKFKARNADMKAFHTNIVGKSNHTLHKCYILINTYILQFVHMIN